MENTKKIGLSLSGGGYRATAFHLGTLKKLNDLGILEKVDIISSISGGSITAAYYCLQNQPFADFHAQLKATLEEKSVVKAVIFSFRILVPIIIIFGLIICSLLILCTKYAYFFPIIIILIIFIFFKFQFKILPIGKEIERAYDKFFFSKKTLKDLQPEKPILVIGSTNLSTSRPFTFAKKRMYDSFYENGIFKNNPIKFIPTFFPVSRAVVASTCIPIPFTPVSIVKDFYENKNNFGKINPKLIDGGIFDNQGIHKITQAGEYKCDIVIVSDAGYKLPNIKKYNNSFSVIWRTLDVLMERIKNFQMVQNLYNNVELANRPIAYFSLSWDLETCIPNFVNNLIGKKIADEVINFHNINHEYLLDPIKYKDQIINYLKNNIDYSSIEKRNLNKDQLHLAQNVGTNLTRLSDDEIKYLTQHAENMTELQVKLYCPSLINTKKRS